MVHLITLIHFFFILIINTQSIHLGTIRVCANLILHHVITRTKEPPIDDTSTLLFYKETKIIFPNLPIV